MIETKANLKTGLFQDIGNDGKTHNPRDSVAGTFDACYVGVRETPSGVEYSLVIEISDKDGHSRRVVMNKAGATTGVINSLLERDMVGENIYIWLYQSDPKGQHNRRYVNSYVKSNDDKLEWLLEGSDGIAEMNEWRKSAIKFKKKISELDGYEGEIELEPIKASGDSGSDRGESSGASRKKSPRRKTSRRKKKSRGRKKEEKKEEEVEDDTSDLPFDSEDLPPDDDELPFDPEEVADANEDYEEAEDEGDDQDDDLPF